MFGLWNGRKASESFYRNFFALLTFIALGAAYITQSPAALFAVLLFGMLSRTSVKNGWPNPRFAKYVPWLYRKPREEPDKDDSTLLAKKCGRNNSGWIF